MDFESGAGEVHLIFQFRNQTSGDVPVEVSHFLWNLNGEIYENGCDHFGALFHNAQLV